MCGRKWVKAEPHNSLGLRSCGMGKVIFDDVRVPAENIIGKEGQGLRIALAVLDFGRIGIASVSLGIAEASLKEAIAWVKEREAFGKKLKDFQAISFMLADLRTEIDAARLLTYRACWKRDKGENYAIESTMAKLYATEIGLKAASECLQVFGHYGYLKDYPLERYFRDARAMTIAEGTSDIQRLVISRNLLR